MQNQKPAPQTKALDKQRGPIIENLGSGVGVCVDSVSSVCYALRQVVSQELPVCQSSRKHRVTSSSITRTTKSQGVSKAATTNNSQAPVEAPLWMIPADGG